MKLLFIPGLGIAISSVSGIITYSKYSELEITGGNLYFVVVSFCIWRGCQWIHLKQRRLYPVSQKPFSKLVSISVISGLYGTFVSGILCLLWMKFSKEVLRWSPVLRFIFFSVLAVLIFTLVYEILYLSKERELDNKIVDQLDQELTHAEMVALRNEMDPHFIFNSLNTLSQLIVHDPPKAGQFNRKLAEVYKYFLLNRNKELIPIREELEFIKNYFFLLQIRHDDALHLHINLDSELVQDSLIIPCALQITVENAIKHNEFTQERPLHIYISSDHQNLVIKNNVMQKSISLNSTKIGLRNLGAQYLLMANKNITNEIAGNNFIVKLPILLSEKNKPT